MESLILTTQQNGFEVLQREIMPTASNKVRVSTDAPAADFPEVRAKTTKHAFLLGMACLAAAIVIGRSYTFYGLFLVLSLVMTLVWKRAPRPWISLVSISTSNPFSIFVQQYPCNIIYSIWFIIFNPKYLSKIPTWIYVITGLAFGGFILSAISWMSNDPIGGLLRQGSYFLNFVLAPFIFLPIIYCRMEKSRDTVANLQGLLYCLIVPSTLILLLAKTFGKVINALESSLHAGGGTEGFFMYQLGRVYVNFLRTEVGFILAALICASCAVAFVEIRPRFKWVARACLAGNAYLLLTTASFGSSFACICGLAAIFSSLSRKISIMKVLGSVASIFLMLFLIYALSPPSIKKYLEQRFEHRVVNKDTDRVTLWINGLDYYIEHPMGSGFTLSAGDKNKSFVHNDYLAYTLSYSFLGGMAYTSLVVGLLFSFFRRRGNLPDDHHALATYLAGHGVIIVIAINSFTDHMTESRWYFNLIWSIVWYCYFCSRAAQRGSVPQGMKNETALTGTTACQGKSLQILR